MEGGIIGIDKKDLEVQEDLQKTLSEIGRAISDFIDQHGSSVNLGLFSDLIQLSIQFQSQLIAGISDADNFMTLDQIEKLMLQTRILQDDLNLKGLLESLRQIKSEKDLIDKKKVNYLIKV